MDVAGYLVGPVPLRTFLDAFLPKAKRKSTPRPKFRKVLQGPGNENGINAIATAGCCSSLVLEDTSPLEDTLAESKLKPDCCVFSHIYRNLLEDRRNQLALIEIPIGIKALANKDGTTNYARKGRNQAKEEASHLDEEAATLSMKNVTNASIEDCAQQAEYVTDIMTLQHRVHVFSVFIVGHSARIIRWDRAGAVVSEQFDYFSGKNWLGEFLFRYEHATPQLRGHDTTLRLATRDESTRFEDGVRAFLEKCPACAKPRLARTLDGSYPVYRVRVNDGSREGPKTREFLIGPPFTGPVPLFERATRGFLAWEVEEERVVFLKDTWRAKDHESEAQIYQKLQRATMPEKYLPRVLICGDVYFSDGDRQVTKTHDYAGSGCDWYRPTKWIREHVRHRVVQEVAFPLDMVSSSRQLTQAMRDTLEAVLATFRDAHMLHGDISVGNIMLDANSNAFLNDWDYAMSLSPENAGHVCRTGTWQFMSIGILTDPTKAHTIMDDVESCFWVFYYTALHHFKIISGWPRVDIFDEQKQQVKAGRVVFVGGYGKLAALTSGAILDIQFESRPMTDAIHGFSQILGEYYRALFALRDVWRRKADDAKAREELKTVSEKIESVLDIIAIFDESLKSTEWPEDDDAIPDPFPRTPTATERNKPDVVCINRYISADYFVHDQPLHPDAAVNQDGSSCEAGPRNLAMQGASTKDTMGPPTSTDTLGRRHRSDSEASSRNRLTKKGRKERTESVYAVGEPDVRKGPVTRSQARKQQHD
ncbi:hypothetical protein BDW22DRAFT_1427927 [Trametopsis cervina]|nr:hypothetical protein BDW22DRAFT_1427927 [Trametopsis cervina]